MAAVDGWRRGRTVFGRARVVAGIVLLLAGLAVLAYVGWEFVGTNYVSERRHRAIIDDLESGWGQGHTEVRAEGTTAGAIVRIPRFGDDYAVPLLEGTSDDVLAAGIGHFEGTADVGGRGNFVLAAHRVTHGEPFADMPELEPGDRVLVDTARATYTYVLDTGGDDLTVPYTAGWVTDPRPVNPDGGVQPPDDAGPRLITLTTCSELFHTDYRLVAFGHLESVRPRT